MQWVKTVSFLYLPVKFDSLNYKTDRKVFPPNRYTVPNVTLGYAGMDAIESNLMNLNLNRYGLELGIFGIF